MPSHFGSPFADKDADVVLRSSDDVDFRVHKLILAKASGFFRGFPYDLNGTTENIEDDDLPLVPLLNEESSTIARLLRMIYPVDPPVFSTLADISSVLEAGRKYDVPHVRKRVEEVLLTSDFPSTHPLATYAIACGYSMPGVARRAARASLGRDLLKEKGRGELRWMTGEDYQRFLEYRENCIRAACRAASIASVNALLAKDKNYVWLDCSSCEKWKIYWVHRDGGKAKLYARSWWAEYVTKVQMALLDMPSGSVVYTPALMIPALSKAAACNQCKESAARHMQKFMHDFFSKIDNSISKVALKL